jgi:hypothetical protein
MAPGMIASYQIDEEEQSQLSKGQHLPSWRVMLRQLAKESWSKGLRQAPATVVDVGVLRNVPYRSFRWGDREVNVYGDPQSPSCIEIGLYDKSLDSPSAKEQSRGFMRALLPDVADKSVVDRLKPDEDLQQREGWTFEVTPPTAKDAYGGWWISVYSEDALNRVRASDEEMKELVCQAPEASLPSTEPAKSDWTPDEYKLVKRSKSATTKKKKSDDKKSDDGSPQDDKKDHPDVAKERDHGDVYVRGYVRKDGKYVAPYTRSSKRK